VAAALRRKRHNAWTADDANLSEASDEELIVYADDKKAILVTNNKDCAALARRMKAARVVFLRCEESRAVVAVERAEAWLRTNSLPAGRVLRVPLTAGVKVMKPLR
jgi:predicted nuclease of predicted toxin-antitoxin system